MFAFGDDLAECAVGDGEAANHCRRITGQVSIEEACNMKIPFSGGCACRAIRYRGMREPVAMINCHCRDCQLSSGAPFASGIVVKTADLEIFGTPRKYAVRASSGALTMRSFCPDCGTPLFTQSEAYSQVTSIRFPTLDDASDFKPMADIYTASAQQWVCLDPAIPHFPQSPQQANEPDA